ncbi:MAG: endonuclease [Synergistaceae bacterium]|nr:endonuclease [Synergistaceae bacterium]
MGIDGRSRLAMVLGVDPGRDKMGWALVNYEGGLLSSGICPVSEQETFLTALTREPDCWGHELSPWVTEKVILRVSKAEKLSFVAVGDGTGSREALKLFERLGIQVAVVDESGTTLEARELYWRLHAPSWWQRCLPRTMRFPPRPLDDLAAWAIARRSLFGRE